MCKKHTETENYETSKKQVKILDLFSVFCIVIVALMFTVSTGFIIFQSINAIKMYNNISSDTVLEMIELKEIFNASVTEQIYSLIYAFMSTAIVGLGGYILKRNNDTKDEIKADLEVAGNNQYIKLKKQLEDDSKINIIISDISIAHQYACAMAITTEPDLFYHSFIDIINRVNSNILNITEISKIQGNFIKETLISITTKHEILLESGMDDKENDEGITISECLKQLLETIEKLLA